MKTILFFGKSQRRMRRKSSRISSREKLLKDANLVKDSASIPSVTVLSPARADDLSDCLWNNRCGLLQGQGFGKLSIDALNLAAKRDGNPPKAVFARLETGVRR